MHAAEPVALSLAGGESYGAFVTYCTISSGDIAPAAAAFLSPAFGLHFQPSHLAWLPLTRGLWPAAGWARPLLALPVGKVAENEDVRRMIDRIRYATGGTRSVSSCTCWPRSGACRSRIWTGARGRCCF
jgi:hypothetical protein